MWTAETIPPHLIYEWAPLTAQDVADCLNDEENMADAEYKHVSFEPQTLLLTDANVRRERWFWLKRLAFWCGLRDKPVHWEVTYEFTYMP